MPKYFFFLLLAFGFCAALFAQSPSPKATIGKVAIDFGKAEISSGLWHLSGGVKMTSANYDLSGADFKFTLAQGKLGAPALQRVTAEGDPAANTQVMGRFRNVLQSQAYRIYADHAVYLPDASRPAGGRIDFTGHVQVLIDSGFLADTSHSTFERATILLGQGSEYPQIETGSGHMEFRPAQ